jgi:predicted transglutaminase-like cysteine proteinase
MQTAKRILPGKHGPSVARIAIGLLICAALAHGQAMLDLGFTTKVSAALTAQYAQKFGSRVPGRFSDWARTAKNLKTAGFARKLEEAKGRETDTLQDANEAINDRIRGIHDRDLWGMEDYWATPAESIGNAGGDCEDYALAKYYLLKELGVPLERLRITYVRILNTGGAHMVLAYYATPDAEPLIMDNLDAFVQRASKRTDLDPVYGFNDDGLQLAKTGHRGKPAQIRAWLALQERLVAESRI